MILDVAFGVVLGVLILGALPILIELAFMACVGVWRLLVKLFRLAIYAGCAAGAAVCIWALWSMAHSAFPVASVMVPILLAAGAVVVVGIFILVKDAPAAPLPAWLSESPHAPERKAPTMSLTSPAPENK
jgi:hypothetical protein